MRKRCRRRVYDLAANPVRRAVLGKAPATDAELRPLHIQEMMSLHALAGGKSTALDAAVLVRLMRLPNTWPAMVSAPRCCR